MKLGRLALLASILGTGSVTSTAEAGCFGKRKCCQATPVVCPAGPSFPPSATGTVPAGSLPFGTGLTMPHFSYPVDSICGTPISGVVGSTIVYEGEPGVIGFGVMDAGIVETCQVQSVGQVVGETISRTSDVMLSVNGAVPTAVAAGSTIEIDNTSVIRQLRQIEERINAGIKVLEGNATTSSVGASDGTE